MTFTVRKIDSIWCLSFGCAPSYPVCLLHIYLQLPQSVETESVNLCFQEKCKQCWKVGLCFFCFILSTCFCCLFEFVQFYFLLPFPLQSALPSWTPASFKQDISEEGREKPGCFDTSPCPDPSVPVSSGTGAWTAGSRLPTVQRSSGDALSWCNTKNFFKVLISLSFKHVYKPRSNWN